MSGASAGSPVAAAAPAAASTDLSISEPYSARVMVSRVLAAGDAAVGQTVTVSGWARTVRMQKELAFVKISDGSCISELQLVVEKGTAEGWDDLDANGATGCAVTATGKLAKSEGAGQTVEVKVAKICVIGGSDAAVYPLAKKKHTLEHLRQLTHMRPRTNAMGSVFRIRNALAFATHNFFQKNGFMYVHSPLITGADCEGAGEMFQVTTLDIEKPPKANGAVDYAQDFFGKASYLTVSGQLNAEHFACAFGSVYTFGPTFRAENSNTTRHLAEFWMIEPEICFADLENDMDLAEGYLRYCFTHVLEHCAEDVAFLSKWFSTEGEETLLEKLKTVSSQPFARMTYTDAVAECQKVSGPAKGVKWEYPPEWGKELQTEHEKYLAESIFKKPVIVYNYPKDCKAFYMRLNDDGKTVAAMDVLFPRVGEMVGGSQREERLDVLLARMQEMGLNKEDYEAYLDLRRYGTQKHAGFGVGFERLVLYATAMTNIRDVIPFPRAVGQMQH